MHNCVFKGVSRARRHNGGAIWAFVASDGQFGLLLRVRALHTQSPSISGHLASKMVSRTAFSGCLVPNIGLETDTKQKGLQCGLGADQFLGSTPCSFAFLHKATHEFDAHENRETRLQSCQFWASFERPLETTFLLNAHKKDVRTLMHLQTVKHD